MKNTFTSFIDIARSQAESSPDATAFIFLKDGANESGVLSFEELDTRARALAVQLQEKGLEGSSVLLPFPSSLDFIVAFVGCMYARAIALPFPLPSQNKPLEAMQRVIKDADVKCILTNNQGFQSLSKNKHYKVLANLPVVTIEELDIEKASKWKVGEINPDDLAFIQYTSGSTSAPKGVMVSHGNVVHNVKAINNIFQISKGTVAVSWLPFHHDMGLIGNLLGSISIGAKLILLPPMSFLQKPIKWLKAISKYRAEITGGPNFAYDLCIEKVSEEDISSLDLSCWKVAYNGAEPVKASTVSRFTDKFAAAGFRYESFLPCYGMAENTLFISGERKKPGSIEVDGRSLETGDVVQATSSIGKYTSTFVSNGTVDGDSKVSIVDPSTCRRVDELQVGEIWVSGDSVAQGYWKQEKLTEKIFDAHISETGEGPFLRTGDLGFVFEGELYITGRLKDLIIIRGRNFYPPDIELTVEQSDQCLNPLGIAVLSYSLEGREFLVVLAEVKRTAIRSLDVQEVCSTIRNAVRKYHDLDVDAISLVKPMTLPKTSSGKLKRYACLQDYREEKLSLIGAWKKDGDDLGTESNNKPVENSISGLSRREVTDLLVNLISKALHINKESIDIQRPLSEYGSDSMAAVEISNELSTHLNREINPTLIYDFPTIEKIAVHLAENQSNNQGVSRNHSLKENEYVAIIGAECRFPGAPDIKSYSSLLYQGKFGVEKASEERWRDSEIKQWLKEIDQESPVFKGGFIQDVDKFDADFFRISPREARNTDPQQRLLLEVGWHALENAGIPPLSLSGKKVGVFVGVSSNDYAHLQPWEADNIEPYSGTGNALSVVANRLSYFLDINGPSMSVDTACSSSLVAIHQACHSLIDQSSDMVLAGGVNLVLNPKVSAVFDEAGMLSKDGKCKTMDATADGYVRGEGCGVVILKRLSDALNDGDIIQAIIKGTAVNHDGRSNGLTAPNGPAQKKVITDALRNAKVSVDDVGYFELHGSGTPLGDPIEVNSLVSLIQEQGSKAAKHWLGAAKANIGHLESAAGIAGLIKSVILLNKKQIPPQINFSQLNPNISLQDLPIEIAKKIEPWHTAENHKRIAGVSSFGFGGTNAHVIVEEYSREIKKSTADLHERGEHLMCLSAATEPALRQLVEKYLTYLSNDEYDFADIAHSANNGRSHLSCRLIVRATNTREAVGRLQSYLNSETHIPGVEYADISLKPEPRVAFLFTGQGAQYFGMGKQLFETNAYFREIITTCDHLLKDKFDLPLIEILYAGGDEDKIHETANTQPALFAVEYALARLWESWGVVPDVVIGHSVGEYVAACIAGVFSLEDGLMLTAARGKLMQELPSGGKMISVFTSAEEVRGEIENYDDKISIAAINSADQVVLSGDGKLLAEICQSLEAKGHKTVELNVLHAFHSPLMAPMLDDFQQIASQVQYRKSQIPVISNVSGKLAGEEMSTPSYWVNHILAPVDFHEGLKTLAAQKCEVYLEVGPKPVLTPLAIQSDADSGRSHLYSLKPGATEWESLLTTLSKLHTSNSPISWEDFDQCYNRRRVVLPTYQFQRKSYWHSNHSQPQQPMAEPVTEFDTHLKKEEILKSIKTLIAENLEMDISEINDQKSFLDMGADSLVLVKIIQTIEKQYNINITIRQFFEELHNIQSLAGYIYRNLPQEVKNASVVREETNHAAYAYDPDAAKKQLQGAASMAQSNGHDESLEGIIQKQLDVFALQLKLLESRGMSNGASSITPLPATAPKAENTSAQASKKVKFKAVKLEEDRPLTSKQETFIKEFQAKYSQKTQKSKDYAQQYRKPLVDWINSIDFRLSLKELQYPIVSKGSEGAYFQDIDGNDYIDLAVGYGVNFFGNNPPFLKDALRQQLEEGYELATQSDLAGEIAELLIELTGVERVVLSNTGTEAVMAALRIARAKSGRNKIVIFTGSYHGTFDGILGLPDGTDANAVPIAIGTTPNMVNDVIMLPYGSESSLEFIEQHAHELAAVMAEPVQSRNPGVQPGKFLKRLREVTKKNAVALIFDEIITGFRIQQGGAQAYFGVKADIVLYGKVVGGGMPIGIIAGDAAYLNHIDGGMWQFGDDSYPETEMTFFGGTFCKHPLALATTRATLLKIKNEGETIYPRVNGLTEKFASEVNEFFTRLEIPIKVVHFGSVFRFESFGKYAALLQPIEMDLFFYLLIAKGVFTWERRICFFSVAHTESDVQAVIKAVKESIQELQQGGFFPESRQFDENEEQTASDVVKTFPLCEAQKQLWILAQMDGDMASVVYNFSSGLALSGPVNMANLKRAMELLIDRHEALRTSIDSKGDVQHVKRRSDVDLPVTDLSDHKEESADKAFQVWNRAENRIPFDLVNEPLFRCHLVKMSNEEHVLSLTVHHIILDGLSVSLMLGEMIEIYSALCEGRAPKLEVAMQYSDFLELRENDRDSDEWKHAETYWLQKFANDYPVLYLPTDRERPLVRTYQGNKLSAKYGKELVDQVRQLSVKQNSTLFMTLFSVYSVLIHKLSDQDDLVIGVPETGRVYDNSQTVVGYCSRLLPVRLAFDQSQSFEEYLKCTRSTLLEGFENSRYPYADLINELTKKADLNKRPLVSATFNMEPVSRLPKVFELETKILSTTQDFSPYDLNLNVIDEQGEITIEWIYNTDIFAEETVHKFMDYFKNLIEGIISQPDAEIDSLSLLSSTERQALLKDESLQSVPQECIHELFEAQVVKTPHRKAITDGQQSLTYSILNEKANQLSFYLQKKGVKQGDMVGIFMNRSVDAVISMLAILKTGAAYVALDTANPASRLLYILNDVEPKILLASSQLIDRLPEYDVEAILIDQEWKVIAEEKITNPELEISNTGLAYLVYTSGTTGNPKGVMTKHLGAVNYLQYLISEYRLTDVDIALQLASLSFDSSVRDIMAPLVSGASLVMPEDNRDFPALLKHISDHDVTLILSTVPSMLNGLLATIPTLDWHNESVRLILVSGEALHAKTAEKVKETFGKGTLLVNQYGPTECTMTSTFYKVGDLPKDRDNVLIGKPIPNAQVYILQGDELSPEGVPGEICIGGWGLANGYWRKSELTEKAFVSNLLDTSRNSKLYRTGDKGRWLNGELEFLGRIDNQVKIRGFRVELGEVEGALLKHPGISSCATLMVQDNEGGQDLYAYMVSENQELTVDELVSFLQNQLPEYAIPSKFITIDELPLTINGKLDRVALLDIGSELEGNKNEPVTDEEENLLAIFRQLLDKENIGIHDDFFKIGGNSLKAILLIKRVYEKYNKRFSVKDLYTNRTIHKLSLLLIDADSADTVEIKALPEKDSYDLSHAQNALWLMDQFEDGQVAYNVAGMLTYNEELDTQALVQAFEELVRRHESLRTVFILDDDRAKQKILPFEETGFKVQFKDLSELDEETIQRTIDEEKIEKPYRLDKGPLLRVKLLKISHTKYIILCSTHHIVSDGWSMNVLLNEVFLRYSAIKDNKALTLEPLRIHYKDYAAWLNAQLTGEKLEKYRTFWKEYFEGTISPLELPVDKKRPEHPTFKGDVISFKVDEKLTQKILALGNKNDATLFTTLMSLVNVLLYRYSGQGDIVIGIPMAGRDQKELEDQIGFYINLVAFRSVFNQDQAVDDFLAETQKNIIDVQQHALYPFAMLTDDLEKSNKLKGTGLFNVMVQMQDTHQTLKNNEYTDYIRENVMETNIDISKYDLTFNFTQSKSEIIIDVEYNTDLFFTSTIEKLRDDFIFILEKACEDSAIKISSQELLPLGENTDVLNEFLKPLDEI
ncbi:amino acid adenylation domain-containing protein [Fulvivirga sp. 29W222]|uniref:Amino acid adenylation domain-containing protein n=1 Tax=Fulvivirga marina TaxID=2494733 RepID=A0A937G670_9BACT|nr:non-ribosomal peptide synthetase/type I polyketide synthase [Fulvivirga marina]MBL6449171.1 amino acid adenylation domain-containing protein [Fulvivirga marina]